MNQPNTGHTWTEQDDALLLKRVRLGDNLYTLAGALQRTPRAILCRLGTLWLETAQALIREARALKSDKRKRTRKAVARKARGKTPARKPCGTQRL